MLTGIYSPTSGNAWVSGESILNNVVKVQESIGYCPQFDVLWAELTVEEHLYFYSKLKNVASDKIEGIVENVLNKTLLTPYKSFLVKELSGGMKRRLSLGISIVGEPSVVFLDEPTTGLDPENKRQIWDILSNCKEGKCMILTTHIMEEAEILTDRIGIIINGELRCLGSKYKLKKEYGRGFKLSLYLDQQIIEEESLSGDADSLIEIEKKETSNKLTLFIRSIFENAQLYEKFKETVVYTIPIEEFDIEKLFSEMEKENNKAKYGILNFAISQVNLEDIFIKLTEHEVYT